jgi:hypothetical protein
VHYLENEVLDIVDAQCNHDVHANYVQNFGCKILESSEKKHGIATKN